MTVISLLLILTFSKPFKCINIIFLAKDQTKSAWDRNFNLMKKFHHKRNLWARDIATVLLDKRKEVHVITTEDFEFRYWDDVEDLMFRDFPKRIITRNHIFSSSASNIFYTEVLRSPIFPIKHTIDFWKGSKSSLRVTACNNRFLVLPDSKKYANQTS